MYGVLRNILGGDDSECGFKEGQLRYKDGSFNNDELVLINGDQKTVGLLQSVQQECCLEACPYEQLKWFLPVPGLFHWRTNYMDMIHDIYSGPLSSPDLLDYSKVYFNAHQSSSMLFYYKEEVVIKSFNAQIVALFLSLLPPDTIDNKKKAINNWIIGTDIRRAN